MGKQIKIGAILSYINIVMKSLVNFMYTPFLLYFVGQADYGLFQLTNSVMISLNLLSFGLASAYIRYYMRYKVEKEDKSINKLNALYLLIFIFISIVSIVIGTFIIMNVGKIFGSNFTNHQIYLMKYLMILMVFDIALTFISSVFDSNIIVNEKFIFQQSRQLMQTLLVPLMGIPLILMGVGVIAIILSQLMVTFVFLLININYSIRKLKMRFEFHDLPISMFKELTTFSLFIFLNQMIDFVNNNAPNFIVGIFKGANFVATFSMAIQIKNMFYMLSTSLANIFDPKVNKMVSQEKSTEELTNLMIRVGRIQMSIILFVMGGFIVVGKYFVLKWAGKQNSQVYLLVIIMVLPAVVPFSQNVGIEIQRAMNKHVFRTVVYIIFAFVNILITTIGADRYGLIGASMGYVANITIANGILMNWHFKNRMGLDIKRYWKETVNLLIPFMITTVILLIPQNYYPINSMKSFVLFGIIYSIIYLFIFYKSSINDSEKKYMDALIKYIKIKK